MEIMIGWMQAQVNPIAKDNWTINIATKERESSPSKMHSYKEDVAEQNTTTRTRPFLSRDLHQHTLLWWLDQRWGTRLINILTWNLLWFIWLQQQRYGDACITQIDWTFTCMVESIYLNQQWWRRVMDTIQKSHTRKILPYKVSQI